MKDKHDDQWEVWAERTRTAIDNLAVQMIDAAGVDCSTPAGTQANSFINAAHYCMGHVIDRLGELLEDDDGYSHDEFVAAKERITSAVAKNLADYFWEVWERPAWDIAESQ